MISLETITTDELDSFRRLYLSRLPHFQDYFLECLVQQSQAWALICAHKKAGYVTTYDNTLTELMIGKPYISLISEHFNHILQQLKVKVIWCKSFDELLNRLCIESRFASTIEGILFREYHTAFIKESRGLKMRVGVEEDLGFLLEQQDEVFDPKEALLESIHKDEVYIFEKENIIVGVGFFTRIHPLFPYYDIGVWTRPLYRQQGIATEILLELKNMCIRKSLVPVCGCAADNAASQKAIQKAGFLGNHTLLRYNVDLIK